MKLALGTVQFGLDYGVANTAGRVTAAEAKAIVEHARASGIDTLDTAVLYGDSEQRLGEIGVNGWQVVSKLPEMPADCDDPAAWVADSVQRSLRLLRIERLYGLLLHRPGQLLQAGGDRLYRGLVNVKDAGLVRKIGVSVYCPDELDSLHRSYSFDLVQAPFSVLDQRLLTSGWLSRLSDLGTELHVRSVFLQGLLLMPPGGRPAMFDRWAPVWTDFHRWLDDAHLTAGQACLRFAVGQESISRVVVGVDSRRQLAELLQAAAGPAPRVPAAVMTEDTDLLNPGRWTARQ